VGVTEGMAGTKQARRALDAARSAVDAAATIHEALREIGRALHDDFPGIVRASLRVLEPEGETMRLVEVWSEQPTTIEAGIIVRTSATSFPELQRKPKALIRSMAHTDMPLDDVLRREGIWSWVSIPVRERGKPCAMLSLSSDDPNEFEVGDSAFFTALGAAVEGRLITLVQTGDTPSRIHKKTD